MPISNNAFNNPYSLPPAQLDWDETGAPHSQQFGDIYFSREGGSAETDYVFLQQNRLAERWRALDPQIPGLFVIAETGFGTGLNFLAAWRLWREIAPRNWRLHFLTVEQYPLTHDQLARALVAWPELQTLSAELLQVYPSRIAGFHARNLSGGVTLQCIFDDAARSFANASDSAADLPNGFAVDAWFLDGFAPAKNPGMWTDELFRAIARLSKPETTFATFTSAGIVKRGLREVGFAVEKVAGHGNKREMLRGTFIEAALTETRKSPGTEKIPAVEYWAQPPRALPNKNVIVIGGGLAGTSTARALAMRGRSVILLEGNSELASGASGNPQGILYTKLSPEAGTLSQFALASYLHAVDWYRHWQRESVLPSEAIDWCGVLQFDTDVRLREIFADQDEWIRFVDSNEASALAGCEIRDSALWFARAGWAQPAQVCAALATHPLIDVRLNCSVSSLTQTDRGWQLQTTQGELQADIVVIAAANNAIALEPTAHLPLRPIRGQITTVPAALLAQQPRAVICHGGYLAPFPSDKKNSGGLTIGATFDQRDAETRVRADDHRRNLQSLMEALPSLLRDDALAHADELSGRVGFRCTTPDYLPITGPVADVPEMQRRFAVLARNARSRVDAVGAWRQGLYVNVGHGSRGLTSTPICAEWLAALICGEPRPLPRHLLQALSPARFVLRDLIRGGIAAPERR